MDTFGPLTAADPASPQVACLMPFPEPVFAPK